MLGQTLLEAEMHRLALGSVSHLPSELGVNSPSIHWTEGRLQWHRHEPPVLSQGTSYKICLRMLRYPEGAFYFLGDY